MSSLPALPVALPRIDPAAPLQFVINAAAGSRDAASRCRLIEEALLAQGRRGELHVCRPGELARTAQASARQALAARSALVAVGGDGTLNTVAQAAHAAGCALGVVPQGTFNYFARTHGIPVDPAAAVHQLLQAQPTPVQVAGINERLFLVNASVGLYPELLEDREAFKARFGRSRGVAFVAACATLLRAQRRLRLRIETGEHARELQTLTLFLGNNRLQLQQLGAEPEDTLEGTPGDGSLGAVVLRPIGTLAMLGLLLHGALGRLREAAGVERFEFQRLVVRPTLPQGRAGLKVACDGEVTMLRAPLHVRVLPRPLYLLAPAGARQEPAR